MTDAAVVLAWLKAAGEDSRLRLLMLCAQQDLSVSDLAEALRQSEPRVSRHLRILCEAGLLERLRQGQWVHYRLTHNPAAANFVQGLLAQVSRGDPLFARDRERAFGRPVAPASTGVSLTAALAGRGVGTGRGSFKREVRATGSSGAADGARAASGVGSSRSVDGVGQTSGPIGVKALESRLGRALKGFVEIVDTGIAAKRSEERRSALIVGVEHLELLETAALETDECVAIAHSRRAAQSARAFAERRGFACRVLLAASSNALCEKDLEAAGVLFDLVFLDHVAVPDSSLDGMLTYGRRALATGGRLWLFERYESLEVTREKVVEHPIGRLRRVLRDVGLACERLSPIEADGEHVIAAVAIPSRETSRGTSTAA
jgi:DNA-binding transcriptional ArsR family regulator